MSRNFGQPPPSNRRFETELTTACCHAVAMHRALLLPEIVATILANGASAPELLLAALTVNKLFFNEAVRLRWYECSDRYTAEPSPPGVRHLVALAEKNIGRAQFYASLIHVLMYDGERKIYGIPVSHWHPQLSQLEFPNLEEAKIYNFDYRLFPALRGIRHLYIVQAAELPEDLLEWVSELCPHLKSFEVKVGPTNTTIRPGSFYCFLERNQGLERLDVSTFNTLWDSRAFCTISQYPNLRQLYCPFVRNDWVDNSMTGFINLQKLETAVDYETLDRLHRIVPHLISLVVTETTSKHMVSCASKFTMLRKLHIEVPGNGITGEELLQLAKHCPHLVKLRIFGFEPTPEEGFTDAVIDTVARLLPNLQKVMMTLPHGEIACLSMASVFSFAKHCPRLQRLSLPIQMGWHEKAHLIPKGIVVSKSLVHLGLHLGRCQTDPQPPADNISEEHATSMAESITHCFPTLIHLAFINAGPGEDLLKTRVRDILLKKREDRKKAAA